MPLLAESQARAAGLKAVPGTAGIPVVNRNLDLITGKWLGDLEPYYRFGPVNWSRALGLNMVAATGPEAAAAVLTNKNKAFANGPGWSFFIGPFFERGLMLLDFDEHRQNRHIMQAAFTRDRLEGYLRDMTPTIANSVASWGDTPDLHFYPSAKQLGLEIATRTFMGADVGPEADEVMEAFHDAIQAGTSVIRRPVPRGKWAKGLAARKLLVRYLEPQVREARKRDGDDLLSALCHVQGDNGERFTDDDVVAHMIFLIMAAHDTSTGTINTMAYYLAKHPEWQQRCREESLSLHRDVLEYDDIDKLTALDLVMKESLRLVSPVPVVAREAVKDTELCGYFIPKGTKVMVTHQINHRLPDVWTDPERFDPDRFSDARREDASHRFAYNPFGAGVHKCIGLYFGGMEIKSVMHRMLLEYEWSVPPDYEMPLSWTSLPYPSDGLPMRLARR